MSVPAAPSVPDLNSQHLIALKAGLITEIDTSPDAVSLFSRRRRVLVAFAAAAAVTAGAYVAVTSLGHGGAVAYAWSPTPAATSPADLKRAIAVCRNNEIWTGAGGAPGASKFAHTAPVVVAERRLKTFSIILSDGRRTATCLLPDPLRPGPVGTTGGFSGPDANVKLSQPTGYQIQLLSGISETGDGNGDDDHLNRTFIYGRSGPDVRSIVIPLKHGRTVTATVAPSGWWEAWYPDALGPHVTQLGNATVTATDGTTHTQPLQF